MRFGDLPVGVHRWQHQCTHCAQVLPDDGSDSRFQAGVMSNVIVTRFQEGGLNGQLVCGAGWGGVGRGREGRGEVHRILPSSASSSDLLYLLRVHLPRPPPPPLGTRLE